MSFPTLNTQSNGSFYMDFRPMDVLFALVTEIVEEMHCVEQIFIKLQNIYAFVCQISFFVLCQAVMDPPEIAELKRERTYVTALTTVLFYSVFGYFATRIRDLYQRNRTRTVTTTPSITNYVKWVAKIILEWLKAVVVVICLREQGIHYEPKVLYSFITFIYYLCTEKIFIDVFPVLIEILNIEKFENLEHLYVPLMMNLVAIALGATVTIFTIFFNYSNFLTFSTYFILYLRLKDAYYNYWEVIVTEKETYSSFKVATERDIQTWDDICAVCLNSMSRARITPCNHLFHPYCLKQCLKSSFYCPLCKQHFLESRNKEN